MSESVKNYLSDSDRELYESKFLSVQQALSLIKSGDTIAMGSYGNEPLGLLRELHTIKDRGVEDVTVWLGNPAEEYPFVSDNGLEGIISILSIFLGPSLRDNYDSRRISFVPNNLNSANQVMIYNKKPNVFIAAVSQMDRYGYVSMSLSQQSELEMFDIADLVILEVNPCIPRTYGTVRIPISKVNYFVHADYPISTAPKYPFTSVQKAIGEYASELIKDGDTIQLGIGGMPDAVADNLTDRHDLGIYTEMIGSSMGRLMACGAVNNSKKQFFRNRTIGAFCWGDQELYDYIDENPMVEVMPCGYVNNPFNIAKNDNMVSVNTALQIDLTGQVCSESLGHLQYSGTGGAFDFAYGAYHANGGKGIIALASTAKGGTVSRIQPALTTGAVVSISRNIVDYVVTEYGVAHIRGQSICQRVQGLISIAHPDFRAELRRDAEKYKIW